jgi:carboxymethylenebutenolidase
MTVLKGEGKVPILFGSTSISVASRTHIGYLSRPDLTGEWPTVIVVPDAAGVTPATKDLCRKLARRELAAVAVDPLRTTRRPRVWTDRPSPVTPEQLDADLDDIVTFVTNPAGFWSNAEQGFGVLGVGTGGEAAARLAGRRPGLVVALVAAPLQPDLLSSAGALLGLYGRDDERVLVDDVVAARSGLPSAEVVIYDGARAGFIDDDSPDFDLDAATDAVERLVAFFLRHLPSPPGGG